MLDTRARARTVRAMSWFATPQTPAAHEAFSTCDRLDAKMAELAASLAATASLLDREEYERVVREHAEATTEARQVREHFDQTAETTPVDGKDVTEVAYRRVAELLTNALKGLDPFAARLTRYSNAKTETEGAAGRLTNEIAHAYTLVSTLPEDARARWQHRLAAAQSRLLEAAERAKERKWLEALDIVEAAAVDVRELTAGAKDVASGRAQEFDERIELNNMLAAARARGQEAVGLLDQAQKILAPQGYTLARQRMIKAGQRLQETQEAVSQVQVGTPDSGHRLSELRDEVSAVSTQLRALADELNDILATRS